MEPGHGSDGEAAREEVGGVMDMETPAINGWKPPVIYDMGADRYRVATQEDVDSLLAVHKAYGELRRAFNVTDNAVKAEIASIKDAHRA